MDGLLQLTLLGKPEIKRDDRPLVELKAIKDQALLFYLATKRQEFSRAFLAGLLWGDVTEERARANLRMAIGRLRKVVGSHLVITRHAVAFDFSKPYFLDTERFEAHVRQPEQSGREAVEAGIELYRGDFLEDFHVPNALVFGEWVVHERERLHLLAIQALFFLAGEAQQNQRFEVGIAHLRSILAMEPWQEKAHRQLMWFLAQLGRRGEALVQFETCQSVLQAELGVSPDPQTVALYEQIKIEPMAPSKKERPSARHNLPIHLSSFVGRESELHQIVDILTHADGRLLTLVGPGGIGKTRLALAAASELVASFQDGVWFVGLAGVNSTHEDEIEELLIAHIANGVGYSFSAQQPPKRLLIEYLKGKNLLLLLDNFEQLTAGTGFLSALMHQTKNLKLLVTSRERLGLSGEWVFDVGGLPSPQTADLAAAQQVASVKLFTQQAERIQTGFDLGRELPAVMRIIDLVGGFPLGLELAANLLRTISCQEIVTQLEHNLDVLTTTHEMVAPRHQSMRVVLDSAWGVLTAVEQKLLSDLSIFHGGFDFEAAAQVVQATLPILTTLIDKSWVQHRGDGRYQIHELSRQYSEEKSSLFPQRLSEIGRLHAHYFADLLASYQVALETSLDRRVIDKLDEHTENIRAAWVWFLAHDDVEAIARFLDGLWPYYQRKGWFQEAVNILTHACALAQVPNKIKARWQRWMGDAYMQMGYLPESRTYYRQTMKLVGYQMPTSRIGWLIMQERQRFLQRLHRLWPSFLIGRSKEPSGLLEAAKAVRRMTHGYYQTAFKQRTIACVYFYLNLVEQVGAIPEMAVGYHLFSLVPHQPFHRTHQKLASKYKSHIQDPLMKAYVSIVSGTHKQGLGQMGTADQFFNEAAQQYEELGLPVYWEEAKLMLASSAYYQGAFRKSANQSLLILSSAVNRSEPVLQFPALLSLAGSALRLGEISGKDALYYLERAQRFPEKHLGLPEKIRFYGLLGVAHLYRGQLDQAEAAAEMGLFFMRQSSLMMPYSLDGFAGVAEVYLSLLEHRAQDKQSSGELKRLVDSAHKACNMLHQFAKDYPLGEPRAWLYQGKFDWLMGKEAKAVAAWQKSLESAGLLNLPYDQGCAHYELGLRLPLTHLERGEHLARAFEIFTALEANYELGSIREIIASNTD